MSSSSNLDPETERQRFRVIRRKSNGIECQYNMYVLRVEDAPEPGANETESSHFDGRVETAEGTSDRILSLEELRNELKDFEDEGKKRRSEEDGVDMVGTEDQPFNFNTITQIHPREGYNDTSDVQDEDPNDEQDHELLELPRLARLFDNDYWRDAPPSVSGLPSRYTQWHQETIINDYFEAFNQATPLFTELNYEDFHNYCREHGSMDDEGHFDLSSETGLKIVLGIALYYMTTSHLERAGFMHAMAVKMVYKLEFHKMFGETVKSVWIAYIIDRDLSLLTGEPYLMQEHDIDPSVTDLSDKDGGILCSEDSSLRFEIFKFRARLATIQGKIFDLVYSVRASQLSFDQRETVADRLDDMLEKWVESIPEPFRGDTIPGFSHEQMSRDNAFRWSCTHATQAAMMILAANNLTLSEHDLHDSTEKDQQRLHIAHGEVSDRIQEDPTWSTEKSFNICGELIIKARESVRRFNESKSMEGS
ncbi:uncharacterized protein FTJAE_7549 [Fusarium tjaetaba]|uniref:Xylanolytic transcriptional activator regulatory domain-containing protein n=1 Tax=Fusarium tjaetaba TaxID=1567544 RepID=A0A8H5RFN6_9HYPO|nr:uncharacterized protein FTJAE_7549 [Fusarium tjaetaba]KAF5632439.1 hypothetical protein FTJAE_7549 [Fusarium tjaetaba]